MEPHDDIQTNQKRFLEYPIDYANFRLTRPYGEQLRSNCDNLPQDVFKWFIDSYVRAALVTHYKHNVLHHKQIMKGFKNIKERDCWNYHQLDDVKQRITFERHDGRYTAVPDVKDGYFCWDNCEDNPILIHEFVTHDNRDAVSRILLRNSHSVLKPSLSCPQEEFENKNHHLFYITKQNDENVMSQSFQDEITFYALSYDGAWILFGAKNNIKIFDVSRMKYQSFFTCDNNVKVVGAAHQKSFFAVCSQKELMLIDPQQNVAGKYTIKKWISGINAIEFSPADTYFYFANDDNICLIRVSDAKTVQALRSNSAIKKIFFASDDSMVIALANGKLVFWSDFSKEPKGNQQKACWRNQDIAGNTRSPLIICNHKSNLLFTVDPSYNLYSDNFIVRALDTGIFLASLNIIPGFPIGVGLLKNEKTVIFTDMDRMVYQLQLYGDQDNADIDFIEHEAHWYQLCCLQEVFNVLKHPSSIVSDVRSMIESYQKKQ